MQIQNKNKSRYWIFAVSIFTIVIYYFTLHRTITWWDNSSYPIAADCFGVPSPPGSLLLTLLGWFVTKLSFFSSKIISLNIFAALLAVFTVAMLFYLTKLILTQTNRNLNLSTYGNIGILSSVLLFAFSRTFWTYATQFTPYILTTAMTVIILWRIFIFWFETDNKKDFKHIFIIALLFGLDFSIHRTNALLIPGFCIVILLKNIRLAAKLKTWLSGLSGLFIGLAFHLITILIALTNPIMNFNDPSNLSRFYDYISLKQYGGGFLSNVFTRKADLFSVQSYDYLKELVENFFTKNNPFDFIGVLPVILFLFGMIYLWKSDRKFTIALLLLFITTACMTIFYFNIPADFFRSLSRHYLPSFVMLSLIITIGAGTLLHHISQSKRYHKFITVAVSLILLALPLNHILGNYNNSDGSRDRFAYDYGNNILHSLKPNAIIFIMGDVYYPPFFIQQIEQKRKDVSIISVSLTNTKWYIKQLAGENYDLPLLFTDEEIEDLNVQPWTDTTISIPFEGNIADYHLHDSITIDTVPFHVPPTYAEKYILTQDIFLLRMLETIRWKQPIYLTSPPGWLMDYCRPEGIVWQIMPQANPDLNIDILKENLLSKYDYNGFADSTVPLEFSTLRIGEDIWKQFIQLAMTQYQLGKTDDALLTIDVVTKNIPMHRVIQNENSIAQYKAVIEALTNKKTESDN